MVIWDLYKVSKETPLDLTNQLLKDIIRMSIIDPLSDEQAPGSTL
jgi:hypothetical protein